MSSRAEGVGVLMLLGECAMLRGLRSALGSRRPGLSGGGMGGCSSSCPSSLPAGVGVGYKGKGRKARLLVRRGLAGKQT